MERLTTYEKSRESTKMRKRLISFITVLSMLTALLPVFELPSFAAAGDSENEPIEISTAQQLADIATAVNEEGNTYAGKFLKLTQDIDLSSVCSESAGTSWTPIGDATHKFAGIFDGQNHKITSLYINDSTNDTVGLFGYNEGTIQNVHLVSPVMTSTKDNAVIGGVCGYNAAGGTIQGCSIAKVISYESDNVDARGADSAAGGICGENHGTVKWCVHSAHASGMNIAGGICGKSIDGTITECYLSDSGSATASKVTTGEEYPMVITGGICGYLEGGTVSNCYNVGAATAINAKQGSTVGGIVGKLQASKNTTVTDCYTFSQQQGGNALNNFGYIVGLVYVPAEHDGVTDVKVVKCYGNHTYFNYQPFTIDGDDFSNPLVQYDNEALDNDFKTAQFATQSNFKDWNFDTVWVMSQKLGNNRPILRNNPEPGALKEPEVSYQIDGGEWQEATYVDAVSACYAATSSANIELLGNIEANWTDSPVVGKTGVKWTIDGQGYTFKRTTLTQYLFPITQANADVTFKNITIDGGAVWDSEDIATRTNSGAKLSGNAHLIYVGASGASVKLENGTILQNNDISSTNDYGSALKISAGSVTMADGAIIRNNNNKGYGGAICVENSNGTFTMTDGEIYGNCASNAGGAIYSGGNVTIDGGEIYNNCATRSYGGAICNWEGTLNLNNGRIYNNSAAKNYGGGILNFGTFNMEDGEITGNTAQFGGGVMAHGGEFTMNGGVISQNTATQYNYNGGYGGGVVIRNYTTEKPASFTMNSGEISENTATYGGGGIMIYTGTVTASGGEITGNTAPCGGVFFNELDDGTFKVSGDAQITGNTYNGNANNVYLTTGKTITVSNPLTEYANIGVTTAAAPAEGSPVAVTGANTADYSGYFRSDNNAYKTVNNTDNNVVQLVVKPTHIHAMSLECETDDPGNSVNFNMELTSKAGKLYIDGVEAQESYNGPNAYILPEGNYYLVDTLILDKGLEITSYDETVNICLNGNTINIGDSIFNGGTLNICSCKAGSKIMGDYSSDYSALIENRGNLSVYGIKIENTAQSVQNEHQYAIRNSDNLKLCGTEVVSESDTAIATAYRNAKMHLSGANQIIGAADKSDIALNDNSDSDDECKIVIDGEITTTSPYSVSAASAKVFTEGWNTNMSGKDFNSYFVSVDKERFVKENAGELELCDYMITEQPSKDNEYTVTANGNPSSYQWHKAQTKTVDVTTDNAHPCVNDFDHTEYTTDNGWTCITGGRTYNGAYFTIDLQKGDILTVDPTEAEGKDKIEKMDIISSKGDKMEMEADAEGKFVFRVAHSETYTLFAYNDYYSGSYYEDSTVKATLTSVDLGDAVSGQITNKFTPTDTTESGSYACVVGYANGHEITSNVIEYTAPEPSASPSASPSVSPSTSPSVNPSASPSASPSTSPSVSPSASPSVSPSASPSVSPSPTATTTPTKKPHRGGGGSPSSYTVTFNTYNASKKVSAQINTAVKEPPVPTREGYIFEGWYTDSKFTEKYDFSTNVTKSFTLYAKWTEAATPAPTAEPSVTPTPTDKPQTNPFGDIAEDKWYYEPVLKAYEDGLMSGMNDTEFKPDMDITRGMFVTVLYRMEGEPQSDFEYTFNDVSPDEYYAKAIAWGSEHKIVEGYSDDVYAPEQIITREQMAAITYRYAKFKGYDMSVSTDISYIDKNSISDYAKESVKWVSAQGIMQGNTDNTFTPLSNTTRAEAAAVFTRIADKF